MRATSSRHATSRGHARQDTTSASSAARRSAAETWTPAAVRPSTSPAPPACAPSRHRRTSCRTRRPEDVTLPTPGGPAPSHSCHTPVAIIAAWGRTPSGALSPPPDDRDEALSRVLDEGVVWGDAAQWLQRLPSDSVDLFFTSPPYAEARGIRIHPDNYVEWFLPFAAAMLEATTPTGSFVLNIKNRVAKSGDLQGQRHPYVYELVLAMQRMGWRWIETYIWSKPNAIPGRFGADQGASSTCTTSPGSRPFFDLDAVRVPTGPRRSPGGSATPTANTDAGFGRDRTKTYNCRRRSGKCHRQPELQPATARQGATPPSCPRASRSSS